MGPPNRTLTNLFSICISHFSLINCFVEPLQLPVVQNNNIKLHSHLLLLLNALILALMHYRKCTMRLHFTLYFCALWLTMNICDLFAMAVYLSHSYVLSSNGLTLVWHNLIVLYNLVCNVIFTVVCTHLFTKRNNILTDIFDWINT